MIGLPPTEFWEITPCELNGYAEAYGKKTKVENEIAYELHIAQAYLIIRWVWQKRVNVEKYLPQEKEKKK